MPEFWADWCHMEFFRLESQTFLSGTHFAGNIWNWLPVNALYTEDELLTQIALTTKTNPKFRAAVTRAASSGDWAWYSRLPGERGTQRRTRFEDVAVGPLSIGKTLDYTNWKSMWVYQTPRRDRRSKRKRPLHGIGSFIVMWSEFACPANQHPKNTINKKAHKPLRTS